MAGKRSEMGGGGGNEREVLAPKLCQVFENDDDYDDDDDEERDLGRQNGITEWESEPRKESSAPKHTEASKGQWRPAIKSRH